MDTKKTNLFQNTGEKILNIAADENPLQEILATIDNEENNPICPFCGKNLTQESSIMPKTSTIKYFYKCAGEWDFNDKNNLIKIEGCGFRTPFMYKDAKDFYGEEYIGSLENINKEVIDRLKRVEIYSVLDLNDFLRDGFLADVLGIEKSDLEKIEQALKVWSDKHPDYEL